MLVLGAVAAVLFVFGLLVGAGIAGGRRVAGAPRKVAAICPFFRVAATFTSVYRSRRSGRKVRREETSAYDVSKATATVSGIAASRCT